MTKANFSVAANTKEEAVAAILEFAATVKDGVMSGYGQLSLRDSPDGTPNTASTTFMYQHDTI